MTTPSPTSPPISSAADPASCPLCGQPNRCAMELERETGEKQPPCWCFTAVFTPELMARVPAAAQGQACICAACVAAASPPTPTSQA